MKLTMALFRRVPMIRFRHGNRAEIEKTMEKLANTPYRLPIIQTAAPTNIASTVSYAELPARYKRKPLSEKEITAVISGGAY